MPAVIVSLAISEQEILRFYTGSAKHVNATDLHGRRVRFPAAILRPFVNHHGVNGRFKIMFDEAGKFQSIQVESSAHR